MGVRLVINGQLHINGGAGGGTFNHDSLINRDLPDQHPIEAITGLRDILDNLFTLEDVIDTKSVDLTYDKTLKILSADVKLVKSGDNAILEKTDGLFVDKYMLIDHEDTNTVHLSTEGLGESLLSIYNNGLRFSHNGTWSKIAKVSEANAWYFDSARDTFVQPLNTSTFNGFVSTVKYRTYTHTARLISTDSDDDINGLIIAYAEDDLGHPHTLSCIVSKGYNGNNHYYQVIYDYRLPDEQVIASSGNLGGIPLNASLYRGWASCPNGITMQVQKTGTFVSCTVSNWNETTLNYNTTISFDILDYPWASYFEGKIQYGYCNQSQAKSSFIDIFFDGIGPLKAYVKISSKDGNILEELPDGLYVDGSSIGGNNGCCDCEEYTHDEIYYISQIILGKIKRDAPLLDSEEIPLQDKDGIQLIARIL